MLNEKPNITYLWKFTTRLCSVMADDIMVTYLMCKKNIEEICYISYFIIKCVVFLCSIFVQFLRTLINRQLWIVFVFLIIVELFPFLNYLDLKNLK